jgi:histidine triad (HIT) family protein
MSGEPKSDNLFLRIARKEIPAEIVYEDDQVVAFKDINPQAPVHVLVIPREPIPTLNDMTPDHEALVGHVLLVAARLAKRMGVDEDGYRVLFNCNAGAGQTVFQLHLHLLGGRPMGWPPG